MMRQAKSTSVQGPSRDQAQEGRSPQIGHFGKRDRGGYQPKAGTSAPRAPCGIGHDALALVQIIVILKTNYRHLTSSSFLIPAKIAGRQD